MTPPKKTKPREFTVALSDYGHSGWATVSELNIPFYNEVIKVREVMGAQKADESLEAGYISKGLTEKVFPKALHLDIAKDGFKAGAGWQKDKNAKEIEVLKERWVECAESHTDIEMELRDLKMHSAKIKEQTIKEIASWFDQEPDDEYNEISEECDANTSDMIRRKFIPKREGDSND